MVTVLVCPPPTTAKSPLAELNLPPPTAAQDPAAVLLSPPAMVGQSNVVPALLLLPTPTTFGHPALANTCWRDKPPPTTTTTTRSTTVILARMTSLPQTS